MALDPNKKKPLDPPGTQIGNLTLIPGSGLDSAIKAIGAHQAAVTNTLASADHFAATRPRFITADSGQIPNSAFRNPAPVAAPVAAPKSAIRPVVIDPSNAASMQLTPPSRAEAYHARPPVIPASQAGASAPAGGGAAPSTVYNDGSGARYTTGDGRQGQLPAGVAVTRQKNGVNAFGATGASVAAATGQPQQQAVALAMPQAQTPNLDVNLPRPATADPYNVRQADEQRKALLSSIDSQQFANSLAAQRGSRGALALQASLNNTAADLSGQGLRTAADIASGDRDTSARYDLTGVDQNGQNQRALLQDQGDTTRTGLQQAGENQRSLLTTQAELLKPTQTADGDGNLISVSGTRATPITGPDGKPVRGAPTKADGAITPQVAANLAVEQLKAEQASMQPDPVRIAALQQQIAQYTPGGNVATSAPAGYTLVGTKDGKKIYRDANGKTFSE